jgi:hypothetical protein
MLTYLASEDPETLSRDQRVFDRGPAPSAGPGGFAAQQRSWPSCTEPLRNSSGYRR